MGEFDRERSKREDGSLRRDLDAYGIAFDATPNELAADANYNGEYYRGTSVGSRLSPERHLWTELAYSPNEHGPANTGTSDMQLGQPRRGHSGRRVLQNHARGIVAECFTHYISSPRRTSVGWEDILG